MKLDKGKPASSISAALPTDAGFRFLLKNYSTVPLPRGIVSGQTIPLLKRDRLGLYRKPLPIAFYDHYDLFCAQYVPAIAILRAYPLTEYQADALISLSVDLGPSGLASSRVLWILSHQKDSRRWRRLLTRTWLAYVYDEKGEIQNDALRRRKAEVKLFLTGNY